MTSPKRPPTVRGDEDRALIGRDRAPARGVPVPIDPEVTPPPREPEDITAFEDFERLDTSTRRVVLALHHSQRELDVAVSRLWDSRNAGEQLGEMKHAISMLAARFETFGDAAESLRAFGARLHSLSTAADEQRRASTRLEATLRSIDERMDAIEREHVSIAATFAAASERFNTAIETMTKAFETMQRETRAELEKHSEKIRALEDAQLADKATVKTAAWFGRGLYVVLAGAIAAAVSWFMSSSRK